MALAIRKFPDPILKRPTRPIQRLDAPLAKLIEQMVATMRAQNRCVGLAAPQVGSDLRLAVMDSSANPKAPPGNGLLVLVNPQIIESEGASIQREGCLSIPDFTGNVKRALKVRVRAADEFGSVRELWLSGFEAIIAQHEVDHLDGKLFLDRVGSWGMDVFKRKNY